MEAGADGAGGDGFTNGALLFGSFGGSGLMLCREKSFSQS